MKKFTLFTVALMTSAVLMAKGNTHSIGATAGSMYCASYKGFIFGHEKLALVADLGVGLTASPITCRGNLDKNPTSFWMFEANPNVVYQAEINNGFSWFAGGGVSLGLMDAFAYDSKSFKNYETYIFGKFGFNTIGGAEYKFAKLPLAISLDFRPGYGLGFRSKEAAISFFDWKLVATVRYRF